VAKKDSKPNRLELDRDLLEDGITKLKNSSSSLKKHRTELIGVDKIKPKYIGEI
jgi:hypothetical protein